MNLIEQLGGYEKAKQILHGCTLYGRHDARVPVVGGFIHIVANFLEQDLLDYRREQRIFEVGDLVVFNDDEVYKEESSIYKIFEVLDSGEFVLSNDECIDPVIIRHTTPEEIKAGKRL